MLAQCRRKLEGADLDAPLRHASMTELDAREQYDAVLCMNSILCYLLEDECIQDALRRVADALRPHGLLVLDNCNFLGLWPILGEEFGEVREAGGVRVDFRERHWLEDFACVHHVEMKASVRDGERAYDFHTEEILRMMTVSEMKLRVQAAGFRCVGSYPAFDRELAGETSGDRQIVLAVRPGDLGAPQ